MKSSAGFEGLKPVLWGMLSLDMLMLVNGAMLVLLQQTEQTVQNFAPFFLIPAAAVQHPIKEISNFRREILKWKFMQGLKVWSLFYNACDRFWS